MADKKQVEPTSKIDALYSWLSYDLQKIKGELLNEMKYSSLQIGSLSKDIKSDKDKSSQVLAQEIRYSYKQNQTIYDGLASMLTEEVAKKIGAMEERVATLDDMQTTVSATNEKVALLDEVQSAVAEVLEKVGALENVDVEALADALQEKVSSVVPQLQEAVTEIKYSYLQHQAIYDGITALISGDVVAKLGDVEEKLAAVEKIDKAIAQLDAKLAEAVALYEENDYKAVIESVAEKTEESVSEHSRQILDAVAAIPVAENVDYNRIVDEVGDKVIELLGEIVVPEPTPVVAPAQPVEAKIDYDKIIYGAAEKVVESLPFPEKVDYRRINDNFVKAAESLQTNIDEDQISAIVTAAVEKAMAAFDVEALANAVAEKVVVPTPEVPEIDYEKLADMVAEKVVVPAPEVPEIDYDRLADMVAAKLAANTDQVYDVVLDETGIEQISEKVSEKLGQIENVDYERIAQIVDEKLACGEETEEPTYELVIDDEGIQAIAKTVAEELCRNCAECEVEIVEAPVEETVEETTEIVEEPVEEVVEEIVEEPVEEAVEEIVEEPVEEVVEEAQEETVGDEIAVAAEPVYEEVDNQLVDAETGLVIRLKRSFTAKMKQSEERIKGYYSDIKNALTSYKKVNSNVSWHGDRFNFGRDTIAKMNICGKTLCFYLALDPEDPELKTTVYHQKNVGEQKAYVNTPFMVKIKSDAAAKKAVRLVNYLAEKIAAEKKASFEEVDYVEEFAYQSTKQLFDEGYIKVTKEKKVEWNF